MNVVVAVVGSLVARVLHFEEPRNVTDPSDYGVTAPADSPELVR